jgi:hypothetical protein
MDPNPAARPRDPASPATLSARAADLVDNLVGDVHERFIRPIVLAARAVVFGLIIATLAIVVLVLLSVALVRLLTVYLFDGRVWASYLLLGSIFVIGGFYLWSKRSSADPTAAR